MRFQRLSYLALAIYFVFFGAGAYFSLSFPVRVVHHGLISILFLFWLIERIRKRGGLPITPLNALIVAFTGLWFISAIFGVDVRMSLEHIWVLLTHIILFFIIVSIIQRGYQRTLFEVVAFLAAMLILLAGLEVGSWLFGWGLTANGFTSQWDNLGFDALWRIPNLSLALSISTLQAGFTAPLVVLMFGWGMSTSRRDYRIVLWIMAILLLTALLLTRSRGGLLSLLVALGVFSTFRVAQHSVVRRYIAPRVTLLVGFIGATLVVGGFIYLSLHLLSGHQTVGGLICIRALSRWHKWMCLQGLVSVHLAMPIVIIVMWRLLMIVWQQRIIYYSTRLPKQGLSVLAY